MNSMLQSSKTATSRNYQYLYFKDDYNRLQIELFQPIYDLNTIIIIRISYKHNN